MTTASQAPTRRQRPRRRSAALVLAMLALVVALLPAAPATAARSCAPRPCPLGGCAPDAGVAAAMPCCNDQPAAPTTLPAQPSTALAAAPHRAAADFAVPPAPIAVADRSLASPRQAGLQPRGLYTVFATLLI